VWLSGPAGTLHLIQYIYQSLNIIYLSVCVQGEIGGVGNFFLGMLTLALIAAAVAGGYLCKFFIFQSVLSSMLCIFSLLYIRFNGFNDCVCIDWRKRNGGAVYQAI